MGARLQLGRADLLGLDVEAVAQGKIEAGPGEEEPGPEGDGPHRAAQLKRAQVQARVRRHLGEEVHPGEALGADRRHDRQHDTRRRQLDRRGRVSTQWMSPHSASPNSIASARMPATAARCGLSASAVASVSSAKFESQKARVSQMIDRVRGDSRRAASGAAITCERPSDAGASS